MRAPEALLRGFLAQNLFRLSPAQLRELAINLDSLASGFSLSDAFFAEKVHRNEILDIAQEARNRDQVIELLPKRVPILQSNRALAIEIVDGCGGTAEGFLNCVERQQSFYNEWATRFNLSPEQFEREYENQIHEVSKDNVVVRQFAPALPRLRWVEAYCQTRRALLQAAIAVRLEGPKSLGHHPDPYDSKPFSYFPVDDGFRLESRLTDSGVPLSLSIMKR